MMICDATFSDCRKYRYLLKRIWDERLGKIAFIGLNPSTADETDDDPTIRRCINYARDWNFGGIYMLNLFAYCAKNPEAMMQATDPIGKQNDKFISEMTQESVIDIVICSWGKEGCYQNRGRFVYHSVISNDIKHALKVHASGEPAHPLYLPKNLKPTIYRRG